MEQEKPQEKRVAIQVGHIWGQATMPMMEIPDPTEWGWQLVDDVLKLVWLTIPEAAKHC